jgi:hypothetical protein
VTSIERHRYNWTGVIVAGAMVVAALVGALLLATNGHRKAGPSDIDLTTAQETKSWAAMAEKHAQAAAAASDLANAAAVQAGNSAAAAADDASRTQGRPASAVTRRGGSDVSGALPSTN